VGRTLPKENFQAGGGRRLAHTTVERGEGDALPERQVHIGSVIGGQAKVESGYCGVSQDVLSVAARDMQAQPGERGCKTGTSAGLIRFRREAITRPLATS
jgi:hypothetical protein